MKKTESFHENLAQFFREKAQVHELEGKKSVHLQAIYNEVEKYSKSAFQSKEALFQLVELNDKLDSHQERNLEKTLMDDIPTKEFVRLNIPSYAHPRISRGLPRIYEKDHPTHSRIKPYFRSLPHLRRHYIDKALLSLFDELPFPPSSVILFTYVIPDGLGDFAAQVTMADLLAEKFPRLAIEMVTLVDNASSFFSSKSAIPCTKVIFSSSTEKYPEVEEFPPALLQKMRNASLIIQLPTYYPLTEQLWDKIKALPSENSLPHYELIGEYGFVESAYFHPKSLARSMGLHFLEKGILIHAKEEVPFSFIKHIEDKSLLLSLFSSKRPSGKMLLSYEQQRRLFFAYLVTDEGHYLYLHALLKFLKDDTKDVDIVVTDLRRLIHNFETRLKDQESYPLLTKYGVKRVVLHYRGESVPLVCADEGKEIHFHCMENVSKKDFSLLCQLSQEFVGCRGDGSFSEVVSADKVYFYDGKDHAKNFLKDLLAIAENQIPNFHATVAYLRIFLERIRLDADPNHEWVDELYFQKKESSSLYDMGEELGTLLLTPSLQAGMKKLNGILQNDYAFNRSFFQLVTRKLNHYHYPSFAREEEQLLSLFQEGQVSFAHLVSALRRQIAHLERSQPLTNKG